MWPIGQPGVDATGVCLPFPTKESLLRNAGETRGLIVMLAQASERDQCRLAEPDTLNKPMGIEGSDVDSLVPLVVWWKSQDIGKEYSDARKTISCMNLFETNEEYFLNVIGRVAHELCPNPHIVLRD
jgi:hypothetical protein